MANLPTTLSPTITSTTKEYTPRVITNDFGDGYSQRVPDGINTINRQVSVSFTGSLADIDVYNNFFIGLAGATSFDWTPPGESTSRKWICPKWSVQDIAYNYATLSATFKEVFDLA